VDRRKDWINSAAATISLARFRKVAANLIKLLTADFGSVLEKDSS
jgi:hypothetical protein